MKQQQVSSWCEKEASFISHDGMNLFYRAWQPSNINDGDVTPRAIIFLHRGHEHSGRIRRLLSELCRPEDYAFAYDARGHGHSPGERGDATSFTCLVADLDAFVHYICRQYDFAIGDVLVVANSIGAVVAATWLHDYAPRVRGVIMAAAAFNIKLYIPLAKPALRLLRCFKKDIFVDSYIRPSMLTHSREQVHSYEADPLITKSISAKILLELADTAQRILYNAAAIDTPVLMLVADKDYVVSESPQFHFFKQLSSPLKRYVKLPKYRHAVFYEKDISSAVSESRRFIEGCFKAPLLSPESYMTADKKSASAVLYQALQQNEKKHLLGQRWFALLRYLLVRFGPLSQGMQIGLTHGFDSGESLDYVYRNQANGRFGIGKLIDRLYLDAVGWHGIRVRKHQLQQLLAEQLILRDKPLRILDIAAGSGRYLLETIKRYQHKPISVTLCDASPFNLQRAKALAEQLGLNANISYLQRDAFDPASYQGEESQYDIVIVSGLYELFSDNDMVLRSLRGVCASLKPDGVLLYTAQPWHPQLNTIAHTLTNHLGKAWRMRPRPQAEMDALVNLAGCRKVATLIGLDGIFTVSTAHKLAPDVTD
ncbi:bifunctional alpha/beta hydrolase/class I SAM-dependent methyltransferase [Aeromonas cavernicola]|uniref:Methyltransferase n=1 Tax=Aeromonas cavernicola TaxID=1006623 RepID=A0A2H9U7C3_9GAMM|nr:bifunctional alpha/beta hydrolase/class I SAM-dependent methyltransferase [Aeromonas cavernicola]PJG59935.1 hypothetical protein CUC53_04735 [Aeromonas cavernicola]